MDNINSPYSPAEKPYKPGPTSDIQTPPAQLPSTNFPISPSTPPVSESAPKNYTPIIIIILIIIIIAIISTSLFLINSIINKTNVKNLPTPQPTTSKGFDINPTDNTVTNPGTITNTPIPTKTHIPYPSGAFAR